MNNPGHKTTTMTYSELVRLAMSIEKNGEPTLGKVPNEEVVFSVDFSPDEYNDWTYEDALQLYKSILKVARLHEIGATLMKKKGAAPTSTDKNVEEDYLRLVVNQEEKKSSISSPEKEQPGAETISLSSSQDDILEHSVGETATAHEQAEEVYISKSPREPVLPFDYEITTNMRHPTVGSEVSSVSSEEEQEMEERQKQDASAIIEEGDVNYYLSKHKPPELIVPKEAIGAEKIAALVKEIEKTAEQKVDSKQLRKQLVDLTNQLFNTTNEGERKKIREKIRTIQILLKTKPVSPNMSKEEREAKILFEEQEKQLVVAKDRIIQAWRDALIRTLNDYLKVFANAKQDQYSKIRTVFINDIRALSDRCENIVAVYNQHLTAVTSNMWNKILSSLKRKSKVKYRELEEKRREEYRKINHQLKALEAVLVGLLSEISNRDHLFAEKCLELLKTDDEKLIDYARDHFPQLHVEFKKGKISRSELVLQTIIRILREWEVKHGS